MKTLLTFLFTLLFALSGFSQKLKIKDFTILYDSTATLAPGCVIDFGVKALWKNNRTKATVGFLKGSLAWSRFNVTIEGGSDLYHGKLKIDDNLETRNNIITITIFPTENPSMKKSINIKIDYRGKFTADFSGYDGRNGQIGNDGSREYLNGGNGSNGGDGENGGDGYPIDVLVKLVKDEDDKPLLKIMIYNVETKTNSYHLLNPNGGVMYILSKGGKGGEGGRGGDGGDGNNDGRGGDGGNGGNGGSGGNGGRIRLYLEGEAARYKNNFILINDAGKGGLGGKRGRKGSSGSNFPIRDSKTILGALFTDYGNGRAGSPGYAGKNGSSGGVPEIVESPSLGYDW